MTKGDERDTRPEHHVGRCCSLSTGPQVARERALKQKVKGTIGTLSVRLWSSTLGGHGPGVVIGRLLHCDPQLQESVRTLEEKTRVLEDTSKEQVGLTSAVMTGDGRSEIEPEAGALLGGVVWQTGKTKRPGSTGQDVIKLQSVRSPILHTLPD